mgnify:CR=1 FL=1
MAAKMIKISSRVKRIFLQRYLTSKFCFRLEECELRDLCCMFENQLWLEQKCQADEEFAIKFGKSLEDLSLILKQMNFRQGITEKALKRFSKRIKDTLDQFYLPKRNHKEAKRLCNGQFQFLDAFTSGIPKKALPPKAYVGKGYRDKGTVKNMAKDGSPSWQEVAMHRGPLFHKGRKIKDGHQIESRAEAITRSIEREILESQR